MHPETPAGGPVRRMDGWKLLPVRLRHPTNPIHHHQSLPMLLAPGGWSWIFVWATKMDFVFFLGDKLSI